MNDANVPASRPARVTTTSLTLRDHLDHLLARWGFWRGKHRVLPGLYAVGKPTPQSRVFVTANYTLSFDALRSALVDRDGYILVLDTRGVNVWCAAGKGSFGTDELVSRIEATGLQDVVEHRVLILPQLGAPGVAAHEVKKRSGFKVKYGPVRAADLPAYLETGEASEEMRRVEFGTLDRLTLIPVELVSVLLPTLVLALLSYWLLGPLAAVAVVAAVLAGGALFPLLLPWIPTPNFSTKGLLLGGLIALPFAAVAGGGASAALWWRVAWATVCLLALPPVTAFLALNFTGATTFTSKTGVKREIFAYVPVMAWMFGGGIVLAIASAVTRWLGVSA